MKVVSQNRVQFRVSRNRLSIQRSIFVLLNVCTIVAHTQLKPLKSDASGRLQADLQVLYLSDVNAMEFEWYRFDMDGR